MVRRRGENISIEALEETYRQHPSVMDVAVHAVPSPLAEDDLKLVVVPDPNATLSVEDLIRWSLDRVPRFALPRFVEFRASLPRTFKAEVMRRQLYEEGITAETLDLIESDLAAGLPSGGR